MPETAPGRGRDVSETPLPGVGIRYEFVTEGGSPIGVIHHRSGRRELLIYDSKDPDTCREVIDLEERDSRTLSELLGGSKISEELTKLQQSVKGLAIDWLPVTAGTPYVDKTIGDTAARTRTGVSVVAVLRGDSAFPAPGPEQIVLAGDTLVVVGTPRGIEDLAVILRTG